MILETSSQKATSNFGHSDRSNVICYSMIFHFRQGVEYSVVCGFLKIPLFGNEVKNDLSRF